MSINVFVPKFHTEEILSEIKECLEKGWTGLGFKTNQFEEKWKEYSGLPFAHFLNSNTSGLHLAVNMLKNRFGWKDGDEIISTPITFVSTNHAIMYERMKPVFADVDEYLCLDPEDVKRKISPKTRAIMFVGIGGNTGRLDEIANICRDNKLKLILDAAHMAGTFYHGKHVGIEADVTIFSFQAVKNLPTSDSGMICWMDEEMDAWCRKLTWLGISKDTYARFNKNEGSYKWKYDVPDLGFKYHGNSIVASIGLVQLKYLDEDNAYRKKLANHYTRLLSDKKSIQVIHVAPGCISSRHLFQIRLGKRDELMQKFYDNDIYPGVHYLDNTEYPMYHYAKGTCLMAAKASAEIISLPLHLKMGKEEVERVAEVIEL